MRRPIVADVMWAHEMALRTGTRVTLVAATVEQADEARECARVFLGERHHWWVRVVQSARGGRGMRGVLAILDEPTEGP